MKQKLKGTTEFKVNEEKRSVVCVVVAHGKRFFGVAKCLESDTFDVEAGKVLAQMRATVKQRQFDLNLTREFVATIKEAIKMKNAIDKLTEKINSVEAQLHVANESQTPNYAAIEQWICEEFAPEVQGWICEEFAPEVQDWVNEEFAPVVEGWLTNEFTPNVITEAVDSKVNELETRINENVNNYLVAQKDNRYEGIDKMLESLTDLDSKEEAIKKLEEQQKKDTMFEGYFAVENMPAKYRPMWESLNDARKIEIARQSKMYDFTKMGILESFWAGVKFENKPTQITESVNVVNNYHNSIAAQMKKMMHK